MNRERAKELAPTIKAYGDGEDIQFRPYQYNLNTKPPLSWSDLTKDERLTMTFPCDDYEYRIKPKPRVFWLWDTQPIFGTGTGMVHWSDSRPNHIDTHVIKVREVIDENL